MTALSLAEARDHLVLTQSKATDAVLQAVVKAAEAAIAAKCGDLEPTTRTELVRAANGSLAVRAPLVSVTSVVFDGVTQTVDPLTDTQKAAGVIPGSWSGNYTVTYVSGRSEVPADLLMGIKELTAHIWSTTQRSSSDRRGREATPSAPYLFPHRVEQWIAPYVLPGFA